MSDEKRRIKIIALIAVILALMGFVYASIPQDIAFEIVKNNTDLCNFNHTSNLCDGTRQNNVTYYTNNTTIILTVYAHANTAGQTAGVFVYRDGILIEAQSGRPLAAPEETWRGVTVIMPRNTSYRVNFTNYHHFNWTEDQILSGRNGTLNLTQYFTTISGGGGISFNGSPVDANGSNIYNVTIDNYNISQSFSNFNLSLNDKVNKTGDMMTGALTIQGEQNQLCLNSSGRNCSYSNYQVGLIFNKTQTTTATNIHGVLEGWYGRVDAPHGYGFAMHLNPIIAILNTTEYANGVAAGFNSGMICDTKYGNTGNCRVGQIGQATKNGTGNITNAVTLYLYGQNIGLNNYVIYSESNTPSYFAGNITLNPLSGVGDRPLCASSTGLIKPC